MANNNRRDKRGTGNLNNRTGSRNISGGKTLGKIHSPPGDLPLAIFSHPVYQSLNKCKDLHLQEKTLSAKVYLLERQANLHGVMEVPVALEILISEERAKLLAIREEIDRLEEELNQFRSRYSNPKIDKATREFLNNSIESKLREVRHKREQEQLIEENLRYLEKFKADKGHNPSVRLENELKETLKRLDGIRVEIERIEQLLQTKYAVQPEILQSIWVLNSNEIGTLALKIVNHST